MLSEAARKQAALWNTVAKDWAAIQESIEPDLWNAVLDRLAVQAGETLLDAGCGAGGAAVLAAGRGVRVSGFDCSEALLDLARARLPGAEWRVGELEEIPFAEASFDAAMAINTLQFTPDPAKAAAELRRVTRPGGRIAIAVWHIDSDQKTIFDAFVSLFDKKPASRGPFQLSLPGELEALTQGGTIETLTGDVEYPDLETALRGQLAAGPSQRTVEIFGHEKVAAAVTGALKRFLTPSGVIRMRNRFRIATVPIEGPTGA